MNNFVIKYVGRGGISLLNQVDPSGLTKSTEKRSGH